MTNESISLPERPKRNFFLRILFGFLWFVAFYFLTNLLVGAVVGGIVGASMSSDNGGSQTFNQSFETGMNAGYQASVNFSQKYGLLVFLLQILVFAALCYFALLPGVGRYKKLKKA